MQPKWDPDTLGTIGAQDFGKKKDAPFHDSKDDYDLEMGSEVPKNIREGTIGVQDFGEKKDAAIDDSKDDDDDLEIGSEVPKNIREGTIDAQDFGKKKDATTDDSKNGYNLELRSEVGFIYAIPKNIRQGNEKAYTPQLISIGPFHYQNKNLAKMAKHKQNYEQKFCERTSKDTVESFRSFIERQETAILNCYEALIMEDEFARMIFLDALFIVELFLRNYEKKMGKDREIKDFLLNETWSAGLRRDLILLENQIPFFVLEKLYNLYRNFPREGKLDSACASAASDLPFLHLACFYFVIPWDKQIEEKEPLHFTDLQRCHLVKKHPPVPSRIPQLKTLQYSATSLNDAGVELTVTVEPDQTACLLDIKLEGKQLRIPKLTVHSNTEAYIRNVMAFEMCHNPDEAYVCAYIELMYYLIRTENDVGLLLNKEILSIEGKNEGILVARVDPNKMVGGMIKKLMQGVGQPPACYWLIGNRLNHLYKDARKHKIAIYFKENLAILKRVYFANLWRGTATVAAFMVVVLTLIQTVLAFLK